MAAPTTPNDCNQPAVGVEGQRGRWWGSFEVHSSVMKRPEDTRLLADGMLGKLTRYLRMCGYDVIYAPDRDFESEDDLIRFAIRDDRVVMTRDRSLSIRSAGVLLKSLDIEDQLRELEDRGFHLELTEPRICSLCNGSLTRIPEKRGTPTYTPDPSEQAVWRCPDCDQHYWRGSHWEDVRRTLELL